MGNGDLLQYCQYKEKALKPLKYGKNYFFLSLIVKIRMHVLVLICLLFLKLIGAFSLDSKCVAVALLQVVSSASHILSQPYCSVRKNT